MFSVNVIRRKRMNAEKLNGAVEPFLNESGALVTGRAKRLVNIVTGRLRGSITYQTMRDGSGVEDAATSGDKISRPSAVNVVKSGTNVEYGPDVEYKRGYSYLREALDNSRRNVKQIWRKYVREALSGE